MEKHPSVEGKVGNLFQLLRILAKGNFGEHRQVSVALSLRAQVEKDIRTKNIQSSLVYRQTVNVDSHRVHHFFYTLPYDNYTLHETLHRVSLANKVWRCEIWIEKEVYRVFFHRRRRQGIWGP